ncbi:MAG: hypothetical protein WCF92_00250 [bacterium]
MITKIKTAGSYGPKRNYYPKEDYPFEEEMITARQRRSLTDYVLENIQDEDERENWSSQLDELTFNDAEELLFEFLAGRFK